MKRIVLALILTLPFWAVAQNNPLLAPDFWKSKPDLSKVKEAIEKGADPTEANRANYDVVSMAINNDSDIEIVKFLVSIEGNGVDKKTHDGRTYLHWAASRGNADLVKYFIQKGWDAQLSDDKGATPLTFGAANGHANLEIFEAFFKAGVSPKQKYQDGANILLLAIPADTSFALVEYLSKKGLSIKDKDEYGRNAFDYAAKSGNLQHLKNIYKKGIQPTPQALILAAQGRRGGNSPLEVYQYLVDELKIPANSKGLNQENVLHYLVKKPKHEEIIQYFLSKKVDINDANIDGNNAFMEAASTKDVKLIHDLLHQVKDINALNKKGESAIFFAVQSSSSEVVQLLIDHGAKTDIHAKDGNLGYFLVQSYRGFGPAANAEDFSKKLEVLQKSGLDLSVPQNDGSTLMHVALLKNDLGLLKKLESLHIDINVVNNESLSPLHRAALLAKDTKILEYLVSLGADKTLVTEFDETAYDLALENESLKAINADLSFLK